ncbi:MAG TPA: hypothetical protein VFF06_14735 [Polyangia bacterium]|nr:hypothetical protein [Polyangia bacterium]
MKRYLFCSAAILCCIAAIIAASCSPSLPKGAPTPARYFSAKLLDTRFHVADHMLASIEMQISGEPFAQLLGRNLTGFDRFSLVTDQYTDPSTGAISNDPLGYVTAIESYEYSKQPMNNLSFESGAGLALEYGPVLNPTGASGDAGFALLRDRVQQFAVESYAVRTFVISPPPQNNPLNVYGWPGLWPAYLEFRSFASDIAPSGGATRGCTFVGGYQAAAMGAQTVGDYECGYNSLNLPVRDAQVEKVLDPAALGFAAWKQGLWVINYWQSLHDFAGNGITVVADGDLPQVGQPGNTVVGRYPDPNDPTGRATLPGSPGVYLGDITLEGFQGLLMLDELDNKMAALLGLLLTSDGAKLGGFASTKDAIAYDYASPVRWWPSAITVDEDGATPPLIGQSWKYFPQPRYPSMQVTTPASGLRGLSALLGAASELFALTDFNNAAVGGLPSSRATFDGDPLPADNQLPDGEETPHDRALAVIKIAAIDLDRLHFDAQHNVLVDSAQPNARGTRVTTVDAAYAIVALRTALRAIASTLTLYSNDTPDTRGLETALDAAPLTGAPAPMPARMLALLRAQADFLAARLVNADGSVVNYVDLASGPDPSPTALESEAAAIRGLLDAYLATSDEKYRDAAIRVYADLDKRFWMSGVRAFRTTAGVDNPLDYTPLALGTLSGALRQYWKLVARRPGSERAAAELLERFKRTYKLVVNGWDDANGDDHLDFPKECTGAGLQMGERALTGELSRTADGPDRDHDCVREISAVKLPAALAGKLELSRP